MSAERGAGRRAGIRPGQAPAHPPRPARADPSAPGASGARAGGADRGGALSRLASRAMAHVERPRPTGGAPGLTRGLRRPALGRSGAKGARGPCPAPHPSIVFAEDRAA